LRLAAGAGSRHTKRQIITVTRMANAGMSNLVKVLAILALLVIGPVMYVFGRGNSLSAALDKINVGDSPDIVLSKMGHPQEEARTGLHLHGDSEYRYTSWPLPELWVVSFKDGKVLEKRQMAAP
jgi:hypothetical protein